MWLIIVPFFLFLVFFSRSFLIFMVTSDWVLNQLHTDSYCLYLQFQGKRNGTAASCEKLLFWHFHWLCYNNWFMLLAVRTSSSYGCTWEVWRALKKLELLEAQPRATLTLLSGSPNFPRTVSNKWSLLILIGYHIFSYCILLNDMYCIIS